MAKEMAYDNSSVLKGMAYDDPTVELQSSVEALQRAGREVPVGLYEALLRLAAARHDSLAIESLVEEMSLAGHPPPLDFFRDMLVQSDSWLRPPPSVVVMYPQPFEFPYYPPPPPLDAPAEPHSSTLESSSPPSSASSSNSIYVSYVSPDAPADSPSHFPSPSQTTSPSMPSESTPILDPLTSPKQDLHKPSSQGKLQTLIAQGDFARARNFVRSRRSNLSSIKYLSETLLMAAVRAGNLNVCRDVLADYAQHEISNSHKTSSTISVKIRNLVMDAMVKANRPRDAEEVFYALRARGLKPDGISYNIAALAVKHASSPGSTRRLFSALLEDKPYPSMSVYTCILLGGNIIIFSIIVII